jgi:hypothetical protein
MRASDSREVYHPGRLAGFARIGRRKRHNATSIRLKAGESPERAA